MLNGGPGGVMWRRWTPTVPAVLVSLIVGGCASASVAHHVHSALAALQPSSAAGSTTPSATAKIKVAPCPARALALRPGRLVVGPRLVRGPLILLTPGRTWLIVVSWPE
jgi:hypothetical protein